MKAINDRIQNEFQAYSRRALPRWCVIQDLDSWAIMASDARDDYRPLTLIEVKRSFIAPEKWRPFADDRKNYAALVALGYEAAVPVHIVYHVKGKPIDDDSILHVFRLVEADPEYRVESKLIRADEYAARFPFPFEGVFL